ncbi:hypothetical protein [Methanopyrus sp.]
MLRWSSALTLLVLATPASATVYVATWTGPGLDTDPNPETNCWTTSVWDVKWWNSHLDEMPVKEQIELIPVKSSSRWRQILYTGVDPVTKHRIDVIYVPGGWRPEEHWGSDWDDLLRWAQLHLGIGYVGICAGATTFIRAFPCVWSVDGLKGHALPKVLLLPHPANPLVNEGESKVIRMYYANGPGMEWKRGWYTVKYYIDKKLHEIKAYCDVQGVMKYLEHVKGWAYVAGRWIVDGVEKGRFVVMSVHPEIMGRKDKDPDMVKTFIYAILWAARRLPSGWKIRLTLDKTLVSVGEAVRVVLRLVNSMGAPIAGFSPVWVKVIGPESEEEHVVKTDERGKATLTVVPELGGLYRIEASAVDVQATGSFSVGIPPVPFPVVTGVLIAAILGTVVTQRWIRQIFQG